MITFIDVRGKKWRRCYAHIIIENIRNWINFFATVHIRLNTLKCQDFVIIIWHDRLCTQIHHCDAMCVSSLIDDSFGNFFFHSTVSLNHRLHTRGTTLFDYIHVSLKLSTLATSHIIIIIYCLRGLCIYYYVCSWLQRVCERGRFAAVAAA